LIHPGEGNFLRIDGSGVTQPIPAGGGIVNVQIGDNGSLADLILTRVAKA
jgi:hypothetical protein